MEVFGKLDIIYQKQEGVELIVLMHKLVNLRMKGVDVETYLTDFDGVVGEVEKRGHRIVEVEKAMFMLCGIVEEWAFLRSQIFLQYGYDKLTTEVVRSALREKGHSVNFNLKTDGKEKGEKKERGTEGALFGNLRCKKCRKEGRKGKRGLVAYVCRSYDPVLL